MLRAALAPFRTVFALLCIGLATLILGTYLLVLLKIRPKTSQVTPLMRLWARIFLFVTGSRVSVAGTELIDPAASYVFSGNHISNIDIPVMIASLPVSVRFLAKKELFGVPVLGPAMSAIHMVKTDRQAGPTAHRTINTRVAKVVEQGLSLVIYPEGTRSKDAELMPFKKGAFRIAIDNQMPMVPVTITGSERVWAPGGKLIFGGRVRLIIHDPIPTAGLTAADIDQVRHRLRAVVEAAYERIRLRE
jgi:1-acyl-sn-glycerol-3-phosphate acyltransferase